MQQHSQKKPFKNFYSKSKGYGSENYDYTSSETSSSYYNSNYYGKSNSNYRYPKSKRHYTEYSTYHPTTEQYVPIDKTNTQTEEKYVKTPRGQAHQDKWQHVQNPLINCFPYISRTNLLMNPNLIALENRLVLIQEKTRKIRIKAKRDQTDNYTVREINMSMAMIIVILSPFILMLLRIFTIKMNMMKGLDQIKKIKIYKPQT